MQFGDAKLALIWVIWGTKQLSWDFPGGSWVKTLPF